MKWVVEGVAYNTATSTLLAQKAWHSEESEETGGFGPYFEAALYQTRKGAYFVHKSTSWWHSDLGRMEPASDDCTPMTAEQANAWLLKGNVKIVHNPFPLGEVPEAAAETEPGATIYLRVPATLKHRVDKAASSAGMSTNAWVMQIIEGYLAADQF
jgi:predicted HicB family RNase H-like nuclease